MIISVDSRPGWSQQIPTDLHSDALEIRMQRIACAETQRVPGLDVIVRAGSPTGERVAWKILHWPSDALAYWELR